jgi:hypothetical protein
MVSSNTTATKDNVNIHDDDQWRVTSSGKTALLTCMANVKKIVEISPEAEAVFLRLLTIIAGNPRITTLQIYGVVYRELDDGTGPPNMFWFDAALERLLQMSLVKRQWFAWLRHKPEVY